MSPFLTLSHVDGASQFQRFYVTFSWHSELSCESVTTAMHAINRIAFRDLSKPVQVIRSEWFPRSCILLPPRLVSARLSHVTSANNIRHNNTGLPLRMTNSFLCPSGHLCTAFFPQLQYISDKCIH